ncbi:hypothetical protein TNIN_198571, partial [Trichonephila inaurata madagascariensis]
MAEVTAVKIPPTTSAGLNSRFSTCERTLPSEYRNRYRYVSNNYIVASLPPEAAAI